MWEHRSLSPAFLSLWLHSILPSWGFSPAPLQPCTGRGGCSAGHSSQGAARHPWETWDGGRRAGGKEQEEKGIPLSPPVPRACGEFLLAGLM